MRTSPIVSARKEMNRIIEYAPGESLESFSRRRSISSDKIIKLNSNENIYPPSPAVYKALSAFSAYHRYADTDARVLKQALSSYTGLADSHLIIYHGSTELINLLWHVFLAPGDSLICTPPTYSLYTSISSFCGATVRFAQRDSNYDIDIGTILSLVDSTTKIIVVCSPNNPTGNTLLMEDLQRLLETGCIIVVDEAYIEFADESTGFASLIPKYDNLIILRTFSKWASLAGLRIGYGLLPVQIADLLQRVQCPFEINVAGYIAAITALENIEYLRDNVKKTQLERDRLGKMLDSSSFLHVLPSQGNFLFCKVDSTISLEMLRECVESQGILLRYFDNQYLHGIRITIGLPEHSDSIVSAFSSL